MADVRVEADTAARLGMWLLDMGFPHAVPRDHLLTMCRGNYHTVWESLMKQILPRDPVRYRRMQVFAADMNRCRSYDDDLHERIGAVVVPQELAVWREARSLREQIAQAESDIVSSRKEIQILSGSVSSKLSHRESLLTNSSALRRRNSVLHAASEQMITRAEQLIEMTQITDHLAPTSTAPQDQNDAHKIIDKCLTMLSDLSTRRPADKGRNETGCKAFGKFNSTALSDISMVSEGERPERDQVNYLQDKLIDLLEQTSASSLWGALQEKQGQLVRRMAEDATLTPLTAASCDGRSQACIADTSAMHCMLTLQALDNRKRTVAQEKILLQFMSVAGEGDDARRELLVLHCEEAALRSRVAVLHEELEALLGRSGVYELAAHSEPGTGTDGVDAVLAEIATIDRDTLSKKEETEALLISAERTSGKIVNVAAQLEALFRSGRPSLATGDALLKHEVSVQSNYDEFLQHLRPGAAEKNMSQGLFELKEFFYIPLSDKSTSLELSFHLDNSDKSEVDASGQGGPKLSDEIKLFLNRFQLHNNRKLVLHNGESLWISEALDRCEPHTHISPAYVVAIEAVQMDVLRRLTEQQEQSLRAREPLGWTIPLHIDISLQIKSGSDRMEHTKKVVRESTASLNQTSILLDLGLENIEWWSSGRPRTCISEGRTVQGKTYCDYEKMCTELINDRLNKRF